MKSILRRSLSVILFASTAGITTAPAIALAAPPGPAEGASGKQSPVSASIEKHLSQGSAAIDTDAVLDRGLLAPFYQERSFQPLWLGTSGLRPEAHQLLQMLQNARTEGLQPSNYHVSDIAALVSGNMPTDRLAIVELLLSQALAAYATDLRFGRTDPAITYTAQDLSPERFRPDEMLHQAAQVSDLSAFLDGLHQHNFIYDRLKRALASEREQSAEDHVIEIGSGNLLRRGDRGDRVVRLRKRLDLAAGPEPHLYDEQVEQAIRELQRRRGLAVDGILGPNTLAVLNRTSEDRIRTIVANMERARWLPGSLGERFLLVDTAGFELGLFEDGRAVDRMKVIVGKEQQRTPMFADRMEYVVVNPYWNLPESIVREEVAPAVLREGTDYLERKDMEALRGWGNDADVVSPWSVDWSAAARGDVDFRVRQKPGPANALGRIKFMFPNKYAIYLHDTPADHLFDRNRRTFSHGCVRVERPLDLASFIFQRTADWDTARVQRTMDSGEHRTIRLDRHLPVYITYFTAWPRADGTVEYRPDVYDRDEDLKAQLFAG